MNYNKAIIVGRLTRDPEKRTIPSSGASVVNLSVATGFIYNDRSGERKEITEYHNVVVFDKLADIVAQYLKKGSLALFEGRLQTRSWDDKDGNKKYRTEIVAEKMQFGPKSNSSNYQEDNDTENSSSNSNKTNDIPIIDEDDDIDVKDIPF